LKDDPEKYKQGKEKYNEKGFLYEIIDATTIRVDWKILKHLVNNGLVKFKSAAQKKFDLRVNKEI
jgi:hypothetical protein